ncbi:A-kinase anchor protein 12-like [Polyodon spathula]|uniref:A-kinase anchor protein 12-like n=1 Tax=Polyodon spathula TaxID=7913 RepID=UPI001B7DACAC|nr:A-kinase anchor protein 12-like [Polyodon spathula]
MAEAAEHWEDPTEEENPEPATQDKTTDKPSECRAEAEVPSSAGESPHKAEERRKPSATATERIWGQFWKGSGFGKANAKKKREGSEPNRSSPEFDDGESPTASTEKRVEPGQGTPPESTTMELGSPRSQLSSEVEAGSGVQPMEKRAGTEEVEKDEDDSKDTRPRHIEKSSSVRDFIRRPISKIFSYKTTEKKIVDRQANVGKGLSTSLDRLSEKGTSTTIEACELENDPGRRHKGPGIAHTRRWHSFKKIVTPKTQKKSLLEPREDEGVGDRNKTPKFKDSASGSVPEKKAKKRSIKRSWTFQVIRKDHSFTASSQAPSLSEDPMTAKHDWMEQVENQTDQDNQLAAGDDEEGGDGMHRDTERKASPSNGNTKSRDQQASEAWKSFKKLVTPKPKKATAATETEESHVIEGQVSPDKSSRLPTVPKKARYSRAASLKNIILRKSKSRSIDIEEAATSTAPISNLPGAEPEREETQSCREEMATNSCGETEIDSSGNFGYSSEPTEGLNDIQKHSMREQVRDAGKEQKQTATVQSDVAEKVQDTTEGNGDLSGKPESDKLLRCNLPNSGTSHETNKEIKANFNRGIIIEMPLPELKETAETEPVENIKEGTLDPSPGKKSLDLKDNRNETAGIADSGNKNCAPSIALVELSGCPVKDTGKELSPRERTEVLHAGHRSGESTQDEPSSHQQPALKHSAETEQAKESLPPGLIVEKQSPDSSRSVPEIRVSAPTDPLEAGSSDEMTSNLEGEGRSSTAQTDSVGAPAETNPGEILRTEVARAEGTGSSTDIFHKVCSSEATAETKAEKTLDKYTSHDTNQDSPPPAIENLRKAASSETETTSADGLGFNNTEGGPNIENSAHINPEEEKLFYEAAAAIVRAVVRAAAEQIAKEQEALDKDFKGSYSNDNDKSSGYSGTDLSYCR